MTLVTIFRMILLTGLVLCAIATAFSKKLLRSIIIFTAYSLIMAIVWLLLESPDLAITEAAVGAGVTGILFFLTLHRLHRIDQDKMETKSAQDTKSEEGNKDE